MGYIEESYLDKISIKGGITKKHDKLWNCQCPYCGDSKTNKRKQRGFFHYADDGELIYSCRNCGVSVHISKFLEVFHPTEYLSYKLDKLKKPAKLKPTQQKVKIAPTFTYINTLPKKSSILINELPSNHEARKYLLGRMINRLDLFEYAENFARYVDEATGGNPIYANVPKDKRIIIPIKSPTGELWGFQGRALGNSPLRYVTIKVSENFCKIFGLDRYDSNKGGFLLEGPFDASFLPNSLSMCGSSLDKNALSYINTQKTIIVYDNEPRNKEIVQKMYDAVDMGFKVYVPPAYENTKTKDVNELYKSGVSLMNIARKFIDNSYSGLSAKIKLQSWKRV